MSFCGGVRGKHDRAVGGDDARPRRARRHRPGGRSGRGADGAGGGVGVVEAWRGRPVPPAAQHVRAVPAGLRRRAAGADRPVAGGGLPMGRLPRPVAADAHGPQPPAGRRGAAARHRQAAGGRGGDRGRGAGAARRDRPPRRPDLGAADRSVRGSGGAARDRASARTRGRSCARTSSSTRWAGGPARPTGSPGWAAAHRRRRPRTRVSSTIRASALPFTAVVKPERGGAWAEPCSSPSSASVI